MLQSMGSQIVGHDWMTDSTEESGTYLCSFQKAKVKRVVMAVLLNRKGNSFLTHVQMGVDNMMEG